MIQKIREEKLKIKTFKAAHLKSSKWTKTQRVLAKITAVLPFGQRRATRWLHRITQQELSNSMPSLALHKDTLFADLDPAVTPTEISEVITTHLKSLRYQQYALTDYYWALKRVPISN